MSERKQFEKSLRGLDAFQTWGLRGLNWLMRYKLAIGGLVGSVALLVLGGYIWQRVEAGRAEKRIAELGKIDLAYRSEDEAAEKSRETLQKELLALEEKKPEDP